MLCAIREGRTVEMIDTAGPPGFKDGGEVTGP